jgi:hypothetical protein
MFSGSIMIKMKSMKAACNVGLTLTQETIIKFPQFFDGGEAKDAE